MSHSTCNLHCDRFGANCSSGKFAASSGDYNTDHKIFHRNSRCWPDVPCQDDSDGYGSEFYDDDGCG